jgi:hypothetical protein
MAPPPPARNQAITSSSASAEASRRNGARSRGPVTAAGKARSARNAVKHGLRARNLVLAGENAREFTRLASALRAELAPAGALQAELADRVAAAAWRARRADRLEAALLDRQRDESATLCGERQAAALGLIRDGNGPCTLEMLVRYRGSVLTELFRGLGALRVLQADAAGLAALDLPQPRRTAPAGSAPQPNEPEKTR